MSRILIITIVACTAWLAAVQGAGAQQLIARFEVTDVVFSPDADGIEDTTGVTILLGASASTVLTVVFEADSITPVDTLLTPQPLASGRTDIDWDGLRWDGTPAPDGAYVVTLFASGSTRPDSSATRRVFIDTGVPAILVDSVTPGVYAPGAPDQPDTLHVAFTLSATTPSLAGIPRDEIQYVFLKPDSSVIEPDTIGFVPTYNGEAGAYRLVWNAANQVGLADGEYLVTITVVDQAGHAASSSHTFRVDAKPPTLEITEPGPNGSFKAAPDSLAGWAWDNSGIQSVDIQYTSSQPFVPTATAAVVGDTVFFSAPLADSLTTEGRFTLMVRAIDTFNRETEKSFIITIDQTSPDRPVLDPFVGAWHGPTYNLTGTFPDELDPLARVRVYRNNVVVDSVFTLRVERLAVDVPLVRGDNRLTATFVDGADNESAKSNVVVVTYDDASGLFLPAPFHPDDAFNVNLIGLAESIELYVYDLTGDLVVTLADLSDTQTYVLRWDGRNGNGDTVKKGPLVAVVRVLLAGGRWETFREAFLFDPNPR